MQWRTYDIHLPHMLEFWAIGTCTTRITYEANVYFCSVNVMNIQLVGIQYSLQITLTLHVVI